MATSVNPEGGAASGQIPDRDTLRESLREEVYLEEVGTQLKDQQAKDKVAADEAEVRRRAEADAKARLEAQAAVGDDPRVKALQDALRISEEARLRSKALADSISAPPREEGPKELTAEELKKLWDENPLAAINEMMERRDKALTKNIDARIGGLAASTASTARVSAERKYPDEFKVLAKEIDDFVGTLKSPSQQLSTMENWDDLISYMRGKHFEKFSQARDEKRKADDATSARTRQAESAGAHAGSQIRPTPVVVGGDLDDVEREIARTMNPGLSPDQAYAEHKKWKGVART